MTSISTDGERLRLGEAAEILGVSADTVRRWTERGRLAVQRTAKRETGSQHGSASQQSAPRDGSRHTRPQSDKLQ